MSELDWRHREWVADFLASLTASPNVSEACRNAGITRKAAYDLRKAEPAFEELWLEALESSTDDLVGEAYRRAKEGVKEPVYYKGRRVGTIRKYSDTLLIFLLKAHRRPVYGDKVENELTTGGKPLAVQIYIPSNGRDDRSQNDPAQLDPPGDVPKLPG